MVKRLEELIDSADKFSIREKLLVGGTVASILVMLLQIVVVDPLAGDQLVAENKLTTAQNLNRGLLSQLRNSPAKRINKQKAEVKAEIEVVANQYEALQEEVAEYAASMVSAEDMPRLLQVLLAEHPLALVGLTNVAPVPVLVTVASDNPELGPVAKETGLYRHGIKLQLRGKYAEVLDYLQMLEDQKGKLIWFSMKYEVAEYPEGHLSLFLQTLSTDERWLGV